MMYGRIRLDASVLNTPGPSVATTGWRTRCQKLGVAGVVFFTVKGLLWVLVPVVVSRFWG